ncbi:MAG TPA: hypothetical protein VHZ64_08270, partial [Xanthobacteraceae bacterium]|nr:hypothetical protein [Xanthobacteraceae bacterium]
MVQRVATVAFEGIEVRPVDVQVQVAPGMPAFAIVGLPDKAVSEARERAGPGRFRSATCGTDQAVAASIGPDGGRQHAGDRRDRAVQAEFAEHG